MFLSTKPDWESCKERYLAWWSHEDFGRAGISVTAPLSPEKGECPQPPENAARWTDEDYICRLMDYKMNNTYYGGEALPVWNAGYPGWDAMPVFNGGGIEMDANTGWWTPSMGEGDLVDYDPEKIVINRDSPWYKKSAVFRELAVSGSKGRALPSTGAIGGCGDTLAALRSTLKLLYDIKDAPDEVLNFELRLMDLWIEHYTERHADLREAAEGSTGYFELWSPGKFYASACDFAYSISPADFERCFLPAIDKQTRYLDHTIHHVDGLGNFLHLDALFSLNRLQAFQILPGAGKGSPLNYPETLFKVQRAGKNLHISIEPGEVKHALGMLSSRGLMIITQAGTKEEADEIIRYVEKNSVVRKV